jgi:hypothetical protein
VTQHRGGDPAAAEGGPDEAVAAETWTPAERALLDAALEFYGAADGVIDYEGCERPRLRQDAAGFEAIRRAMSALEERVVAAHAAGVAPERIAQLAHVEHEMVDLILRRRGGAPDAAES